MSRDIQVGWLQVPAHDYHDASYECAAWWQVVAIPAQRVPVMLRTSWEGRQTLHATAYGTVISAYFGSLYCGMPIGKWSSAEEARYLGRDASQRYSWSYDFERVASEIEFLPSYAVATQRKTLDCQYEGNPRTYRYTDARIAEVKLLGVSS